VFSALENALQVPKFVSPSFTSISAATRRPVVVVALVALGIPRWQLTVYLPALVGLGVGMVIGACAAQFLSPRVARNVTLSLAAMSATALLFASSM
jgi:hypothetical protein